MYFRHLSCKDDVIVTKSDLHALVDIRQQHYKASLAILESVSSLIFPVNYKILFLTLQTGYNDKLGGLP